MPITADQTQAQTATRREEGGHRTVNRTRAAARDFVDRAADQTPARKAFVDFRHAELQDDNLACRAAFQVRSGVMHSNLDVLYLFR
jgi:hypothetical protein